MVRCDIIDNPLFKYKIVIIVGNRFVFMIILGSLESQGRIKSCPAAVVA